MNAELLALIERAVIAFEALANAQQELNVTITDTQYLMRDQVYAVLGHEEARVPNALLELAYQIGKKR